MFVKKEMLHYTRKDIDQMEKIFRLNLINSCTGYKSANLIGTQSADGKTNLAVFSSITHLGSNPPLIGFVLRPTTVPRDSYRNIKASSLFTVNHIHHDTVADAHHTSAKYPEDVSEFSKTDFEPEYIDGFAKGFVELNGDIDYEQDFHGLTGEYRLVKLFIQSVNSSRLPA